jgi:type II secretory pathway component PulK
MVPAIKRDFCTVLAATVTIAPSRANANANALPSPRLAPVTMATLSLSFITDSFTAETNLSR